MIQLEASALRLVENMVDENFIAACRTILNCTGRVVVTGMGKSGHIARKIAATLAATGTPSLFLHPAEAAHGDMGVLVHGDVVLALSNSGNTTELKPLLRFARARNLPVIGVASHATSTLMKMADIRLTLPQVREACAANLSPTTSTTMQLALGDALALAVMDERGVERAHLSALHPGGAIGFRLAPVADIMHGPDRLPIVAIDAGAMDILSTMTSGGFGIAGVVDGAGALLGVITDGDVRRHFNELGDARAADIMTRDPKTLSPDMSAEDALLFLNDAAITAAFVIAEYVDGRAGRCPIGIVHIHDFLRFGLS